MSQASKFHSYQTGFKTPDQTPFKSASPNLKALRTYAGERWGLRDLGIYNRRPIRNGVLWSSHAYGAALDLGYTDRATLDAEVLPFLIGNSFELGIQRVHDYQRSRYWQAGRGWINSSPGKGGAWIHVETHPDAWYNDQPIGQRDTATTPHRAPAYPGIAKKLGSTGEAVKLIQRRLGLVDDGNFGPVTNRAVMQFQAAKGLTIDGIVGRMTWADMFPT